MEKFETVQELKEEGDIMKVVNGIFNLGGKYNLDKVDLCKNVTAISELGTNLIKYAQKGKLRVKVSLEQELALVEVESTDEGPGIPNISEAMEERFSSGSSLGVGLPSIKRLSDTFEIESSKKGTIIKITKRIARNCD